MNVDLDLRVLVEAQHPATRRVADRLRQGLDREALGNGDSLAQGYRASLLRHGPHQIVEQSGQLWIPGPSGIKRSSQEMGHQLQPDAWEPGISSPGTGRARK